MAVHDRGSIWTLDIKDTKGKVHQLHGDWRPMRDSLNQSFDISSRKFPYVSNKKIYENVIGQIIEFESDFLKGGWRPTGKRKFKLKISPSGKIRKLEGSF